MTDTRAVTFAIDGFGGTLIRPGDEDYDDARQVFNGMIDRSPALIARCTSAADVAAVVRLARAEDLPLSVYGGGHGVTGSAVVDAGVCVDLRGMKRITVDPVARIARVEGGVVWGDLDAATQEHGLAVTGGRASTTGVGGLALGSGSGWLERALGFTCDNLLAAEVVTADGREVRASEDEHPDLFWGLRGGGGNFGVVTAFHLRLHSVGPIVLGGMLLFTADRATDVVRSYRDFMASAPDEVGSGLAFITAPPEDFVPEPVRGHPVVAIICCYVGPVEEGEEVLRPLRELGPGLDMVQPMPYVEVQRLIEAGLPKGMNHYWTADFLDELPDEAVDELVRHATKPVSPMSQMLLIPGGGAIARVDEDAMAFGQRSAPWNIHYLSVWADAGDTETNVAYTRGIAGAMKPWTTGRAYLNFIGDEGSGRVEAAFGPEKYARLAELKRTWDPDNLFRHNQNIQPAPQPATGDHDAIQRVVQLCLDGEAKGDVAKLQEAFHAEARMFGEMAGTRYDGPIQLLFDMAADGPADTGNYQARILSIIQEGDAATAVVAEEGYWGTVSFVDFLSLCRIEGTWKIVNKTFAHTGGEPPA